MRASLALFCVVALAACSSPPAVIGHGGSDGGPSSPPADAGDAGHDASDPPDASDAADAGDAAEDAGHPPDAGDPLDAGDASDAGDAAEEAVDAGGDADAAAPAVDALGSNRDRLLGSYFDFLKTSVATPQSNGLSGVDVATVCDVWAKLDPSARAVFLTLTARMQGSVLGSDGRSMLWHVVKVYRISGGQGATATSPGSCGGGEYNRMIMSMDAALQSAALAANAHKGAIGGNGKRDIADVSSSSFWRDSHDLAGPHAPFDRSDETEGGAPRGQAQFFADPSSSAANAPLGRMDLASLVDPYALEVDHDYDCVHDSNPLCSYVFYGPFCFPEADALGTEVYAKSYGGFEPDWQPSGCGP